MTHGDDAWTTTKETMFTAMVAQVIVTWANFRPTPSPCPNETRDDTPYALGYLVNPPSAWPGFSAEALVL
eukprot:scaffold47263_cov63-Phaeocystis_antarctica.AAC.3